MNSADSTSVLSAERQFALGRAQLYSRGIAEAHVARGVHPLHGIVLGQMHDGFVGQHGAALGGHLHALHGHQSRLFGDGAGVGQNVGRLLAFGLDIDRRVQGELVVLGVVGRPVRRPSRLRQLEIHLAIALGHAGLLVEGHSHGRQMDGVFRRRRRRPGFVSPGFVACVSLQIDMNQALGNHLSGLLVIVKIVAGDLVEAVGLLAVHNDVHIVQCGVAARLNCVALEAWMVKSVRPPSLFDMVKPSLVC